MLEEPKFCICENDPCTFPNCKTGQRAWPSHRLKPENPQILSRIHYELTGRLSVCEMFEFFNIVSEDCPLFPEAENPDQKAKRFDRCMSEWLEKILK